jgi:UDP-N-acetylglucosamine 2-epimerase
MVEKLKIASIVGKRPEIIKLSAVMSQKGESNVKQGK